MSWNLYIHKFNAYPKTDALGLNDRVPLGTVAEVRDAVARYLPVEWSRGFWGTCEGERCHLEIHVGDFHASMDSEVDVGVIEIRGDKPPLALLGQMAADNGWVLWDTDAERYLPPAVPDTPCPERPETPLTSLITRLFAYTERARSA